VPHYGYSFEGFDPAVHVRASGREVNVSPKAAREIAVTIRGMTLSKAYLNVLHNLEGNSEFKGLDPDRVKIIHAAGYAGRTQKDYVPRAFGRSSPNFHQQVHIEVVGKEV